MTFLKRVREAGVASGHTSRSRSRGGARRWGAALAFALAVGSVAVVAGGAQAQSSNVVLVSNVDLDNASESGGALWNQDFAQDFTTGTNTAGYTVSSVEISLMAIGTDVASPTVHLVSGSAHATDGVELTAVDSTLALDTTALYEYTAPANTTLTSATQYWVVIEHDGDDVRLKHTDIWEFDTRYAEDTALDGWSIGNVAWYRGDDETGAFSYDEGEVFLIRVNGAPIGGV